MFYSRYIEYTQVISSLIMELYMSDVLLSNVGSEDFKNFFGDEPSYYVDKTRFIKEALLTQLSQLGIWVKTFNKCGLALRLLFKNTIMFFLFRSAYVPKEFLDKVGSLLVPVI